MPFRLVGNIDDRPTCLLLATGRNLVGSAPECDLQLEHPTVSRRHAEVIVGAESLEVADLGSSNGTFVGSRRIAREAVALGDRLGFGRVSLTLEWVAEADLQPAVLLPSEPSAPAPLRAESAPSTTLGAQAADSFALQHFPELVERLLGGAGLAEIAQAAGARLFAALPAAEVEVLVGPRESQGVLFQARRQTVPSPGAEVVAGDGELAVRVVFIHANAARVFRRLVEGVAAIIRLAAGGQPAPAPAAEVSVPAPPEPASVSTEVQRLYAEAARVAQGDVGVLICGESGTGKELLARYIHATSRRSRGPFVALNCAALPRDLLESELFGIERGVATGVEARPGTFELAHDGTLFLDEIGDMGLETQARILRVLQEGEVYRLGGSSPRKAAVRVVAATNREVRPMLADGRFREDLYYRIATWVAELPPLRDRRADIPNLAAHFLAREAAKRGLRVRGISRGALDQLMSYSWPGNIRQLEKEMSRAVLFLADGDLLDTARLSQEIRLPRDSDGDTSLAAVLERVEREEIRKALRLASGDIPKAAELLGLARSTLYRRIKQLGVEIEP
ncbi:MAG TPA: sigma 54-interacting transcriptional regulator, partial [Thermoanaerobaculia bacterium]|nr:sigma 54-interacting transcriptional regulator [Thermoanaerobaculia bacterium]